MKLKDARHRRKLTQEQLEVLSGVSQGQISTLENTPNVSPSVDTDKKLSKALRVRPGTLEYGASQSEAVAS